MASPTIKDCVITDCSARGPGLAILCYYNADALIENCVIEDNIALFQTSYAGAIFCNDSSPEIIGCTIRGTRPEYGSPHGAGGISCSDGSDALITGCTITVSPSSSPDSTSP